ncbi:MAG: flagellar biosynthesis anti-sigma factor FlgM [Bilophila sp.]
MEIKNINLDTYRSQLGRSETHRTQDPGAAKTAPMPASAAALGDRVSVSHDALLRTEAFRAALNTPDVRQEKVNKIKERIDSGTYQIDNKRIASKLVQSELALFRK